MLGCYSTQAISIMTTTANKNKKGAAQKIILMLLFGVLSLATGYFTGKYLVKTVSLPGLAPEGMGEKVLYVAIGLFAIWLVIALHELGHLLAGLLQGFRMALYTAGFLGARGVEKGVQFFFNREMSMFGGLAATFPEQITSGPALRRKFAWIVAAGPLTSLLVAILSLGLGWWILPELLEPAPLMIRAAVLFLFITGGFSALIFLATSLPIPSTGFMTDGARFLSLLSGGEKGQREEAGLAVMSLMGAGKLPGEYPPELLTPLTALPPENLLGLNGHFVAFTHFLDRNDFEAGLSLARTIEANIHVTPAGPFRRYYLKDLVFFYAFVAQDAEKARGLWATIEKGAEKDRDAASFRVKAALALLGGQYETATALVKLGWQTISELPFQGQRRFEEKWLNAIQKKIQETTTTAVTA